MTLHLHIKKDSSLQKMLSWVNGLSLLVSLLFARLILIVYASHSFSCRGVANIEYPIEIGKQVSEGYMYASNICSYGDMAILGIGVLVILSIFGVSQFINHKRGKLTAGNFIIMLIMFSIITGLLVCFIIGENNLMYNGLEYGIF